MRSFLVKNARARPGNQSWAREACGDAALQLQRSRRRGPWQLPFSVKDEAKAARSAGLRPGRALSWRKNLRKCKGGKGERIEKRMHRHRDKNGTAPFVRNRETTS